MACGTKAVNVPDPSKVHAPRFDVMVGRTGKCCIAAVRTRGCRHAPSSETRRKRALHWTGCPTDAHDAKVLGFIRNTQRCPTCRTPVPKLHTVRVCKHRPFFTPLQLRRRDAWPKGSRQLCRLSRHRDATFAPFLATSRCERHGAFSYLNTRTPTCDTQRLPTMAASCKESRGSLPSGPSQSWALTLLVVRV